MGKKFAKRNGVNEKPSVALDHTRPRILFAVGDAECFYTEGQIWRLIKILKARGEWDVLSVTSDDFVRKSALEAGIENALIPLSTRRPNWDDQLSTMNELINKTADLIIPGTQLPLWKPLAPDEFRGSMLLFGAEPKLGFNLDLVIVPLMCVDNNSLHASYLYTAVVAQARAQRIPVVALEVSPLGNRYTLSQLAADHYLVKNPWSKNFLIAQSMAAAEQISILRPEECALLRPGRDSYIDGYFEKESLARQVVPLIDAEWVVLVPHHVAFIWEVRQILSALAALPDPPTVVIQANPHISRRQFTEPELIAKVYEPEIKRLNRVVINTNVGIGLMAQIADLIVSPYAGTVTEGASLRQKPVIICQLMTDESRANDFLYWQPDASKVPELICSLRQKGIIGRVRITDAVQRMISRRARQAA